VTHMATEAAGIVEPGVYRMSDAEYQADPCQSVSLRSTTAWKLIEKGSTPAHAAYSEPRLNPEYEREEKRFFDIGKACHSLLFGRGAEIAAIDGYDYSRNEPGGFTKTQKCDLRDAAYNAGQIPLLLHEVKQVASMHAAAERQIAELVSAGTIEANPFGPEHSEKVIVWRDPQTQVLCRAMMDGHSWDHDTLDEYKTEGQSAHIEKWQWKARRLGYIFRLAYYRRGLEALKLSYSPSVRVFVQETNPPYLLAFHRIEDELIAQEDARVGIALRIWKRCLERNHFPGYPVEGFDFGLSDRERQQEATAQPHSEHTDSADLAASLNTATPLFPKR
jgi:hypothetical protein